MANLDLAGNLFSLGSLVANGNTVGHTLAFSDDATTRLNSILGRPQSEWVWSSSTPGVFGSVAPMMKLEPGNRLTLFDPATPATAAILLNPDPAVGSRINGPLRLPPAGDLDMGTGRPLPCRACIWRRSQCRFSLMCHRFRFRAFSPQRTCLFPRADRSSAPQNLWPRKAFATSK